MAATLSFTPLYGAKSNSPYCFLLKVGAATVLLDCGWNEQFDVALLEPVLKVVQDIDLVLLTYPDTWHLGALPYLHKSGLKAAVYATAPVVKLGLMFMYDHHYSQYAVLDFKTFSMEDIDKAFGAVKTIKHFQQLQLDIKGTVLSIQGYPAGHMLGGTLWVIEAEGESIVYAVDTNHVKERHLNEGQLSLVPSRPAVLILDASQNLHQQPQQQQLKEQQKRDKEPKRVIRERMLKDAVLSTLRNQGNVLLPVDTAGRMFELLMVLDKLWAGHGQKESQLPYPIALLSPVADSAISSARNMLEYMSSEVQREFNNNPASNPVNFRGIVRVCHHVRDVARLGPGPKVVLASGMSLDTGMARELLFQWGTDARNTVIFTQQPRPGTLAAHLLAVRPHPAVKTAAPPLPTTLSLTVGKRVPLEGQELEAYYAEQAAAEAEAAAAAGAEDNTTAEGAMPLRESSGVLSQLKRSNTGAMEQVLPEGNGLASMFDDEGARSIEDSNVLLDGFKPPPHAMYSMFPDEQQWLQQDWDLYGAVMDTTGLKRKPEDEIDVLGAADDDDDQQVEEVPTKVIREQVTLQVAATAQLLDGFSGGSDRSSVCTFAAAIAPRALVLVGGSEAQTAEMARESSKMLSKQQTRVLQPGTGETIMLSLSPCYPVAVSSTLLEGLSKHTLASGGTSYDVAWLDAQIGRLAATGAAATAAEQAVGSSRAAAESGQELQYVLQPPGTAAAVLEGLQQQEGLSSSQGAAAADADAMDVDHAGAEASERRASAASALGRDAAAADADAVASGDHGGIFIGNVRLSDVKGALAAAGIPSEFSGPGRLRVGSALFVRTDGSMGELVIEGPLSDDYFKVRDIVYKQYSVC